MQMLTFIKCFCGFGWAGLGMSPIAVFGVPTLTFNPIRLLCLVGWVYVCLYFVQRVQFSPLVPKNAKAITNLVTIVAGPIPLFMIFIIDVIKKSSRSDQTILETLKQQFKGLISGIKGSGIIHFQETPAIRLLDSSGRNIKEIYGHDKGKRQTSNVLDLTEQIILEALEERASDILIDPKDESSYTLRIRVDGVLREVEQIERETCKAITNSIKAVSNMDISEKRRPQDGAFIAKTFDETISFRVASAGVLNGEKLSIRVLNQSTGTFTLDKSGLSKKQRDVIADLIKKPSGMILLCGPTGSGKTTTLYGMLNEIDLYTRNVITVEDPIEYVLPNASQIEINPKADITFAKSLRSILRQDPDVICIGEIRDEETAGIALRASQTGHLVLATIHSNSNSSALVRLMDLDVSNALIASGLSVTISQRLLRRLCENCKVNAQLSQSRLNEFHKLGINYSTIFQAEGCEKCHGTGYYGRIAIFDILIFDDKLKNAIANSQTLALEMRKNGDKKGKSNLQKQGLKMVVSGITSFEELKRVVG